MTWCSHNHQVGIDTHTENLIFIFPAYNPAFKLINPPDSAEEQQQQQERNDPNAGRQQPEPPPASNGREAENANVADAKGSSDKASENNKPKQYGVSQQKVSLHVQNKIESLHS